MIILIYAGSGNILCSKISCWAGMKNTVDIKKGNQDKEPNVLSLKVIRRRICASTKTTICTMI